jgi:hypothetical protein
MARKIVSFETIWQEVRFACAAGGDQCCILWIEVVPFPH